MLLLLRVVAPTRSPDGAAGRVVDARVEWRDASSGRCGTLGVACPLPSPMMLTRSLKQKIAATCGAMLGFVLLHEVTMLDSKGTAAREMAIRETTARPSPGARLRFSATAYCKGTTTASGAAVRTGIAAADPALLPVGSVIQVDSLLAKYNGIYTIMDTGPAVQGTRARHLHVELPRGARPSAGARLTLNVLRLGWNPRASSPASIQSMIRIARASDRRRPRGPDDAAARCRPGGTAGVGRPTRSALAAARLRSRDGPAPREDVPRRARALLVQGLSAVHHTADRAGARRHRVAAGARLRLRHRHQHGAAGGARRRLRLRPDAASDSITRRRQGRARVARASITHIPFRSEAFDLATSFDVLVCLDEAQETRAMRELARMIKPGGACS